MERNAANSPILAQPNVLSRPRLIEQIRRSATDHLVWIVAAGGYGKTTLGLNFLADRGDKSLHLPIPRTAFGLGEFFYSLRQRCLDTLGEQALVLPILTAEYSASPERFTDQFIHQWLRLFPVGSALLIDDLHHLPDDHPLQQLIIQLCERLLAAGMVVVIASRHEPPAAWSGFRGQGKLAFIEEADLVFTRDEQDELLQHHQVELAQTFQPFTTEAQGWAAGLMLLIEHSRRQHRLDEKKLLQRSLNDWFEQEVFIPLGASDQELLMRSAWVRLIPDTLVAKVTELEGAATRLGELCFNHAFVRQEHNPDLGACHVLHDLFREYVMHRAKTLLGDEAVSHWKQRWGQALWHHGYWTEGATLLIETGSYDLLAQGLREQSGPLLQLGRGDQVFAWLQALPADIRDNDPYLQLWQGTCLILADTRVARALLSRVWQAMRERKDTIHMSLAWSGIVDSIWLEWAHISEYDPWIDAFLEVEDDFRTQLPPALWFKVLRGMLTAIGYARPGSEELKRWHQEALSAISNHEVPADERLMMASQLMYLSTWQFGRRADAALIMKIVGQSPHLIEQARPLARCLWATFDSLWSLLFEADRERCLAIAEQGRALIREHGISTWDNAIPPIHCALCFHDKEAINDWVAWFMRTELKAHRPFYDTFQAHVLSGQAWVNGHLEEAIEHAKRSIEAMSKHGSESISAGFGAMYASLLSEAGRHKEALSAAASARQAFRSFDSAFVDIMVYLTLARIPLHRNQPNRALPFIRRAFRSGARERLFFPVQIRNEELATLAALALREQIEPDYVHWLIKARQLPPPSRKGLRLNWPWPCRLLVLGRFTVEIAGEEAARPPQKRARALLSELILAGKDGLPMEHLARELWPDSEPDKATNTLHVTAHRVREALGNAEAILVDAGHIRLNPKQVWIDAWELEDLAIQVTQLDEQELEQAVALFRGRPVLQVQDETQLAILHETLNQHYLTLVLHLAKRFETDQPKRAQDLYRRAQKHLPLEQTLWAGLLRTEAALGNARTLKLTFDQAKALYQRELESAPPERLVATYLRLKDKTD